MNKRKINEQKEILSFLGNGLIFVLKHFNIILIVILFFLGLYTIFIVCPESNRISQINENNFESVLNPYFENNIQSIDLHYYPIKQDISYLDEGFERECSFELITIPNNAMVEGKIIESFKITNTDCSQLQSLIDKKINIRGV